MKKLTNAEYLDFNDHLSHHNENLVLGEFDLVDVLDVKEISFNEPVYDLVVSENRNYQVSDLGIVHNGGRRAGAGTVALPIWHADIEDFLDMQTEHGDQRLKSHDVFPQLVIPDLFMERMKENLSWTTFCPFEVKNELGIDIRGKYGSEFENLYEKIEAAFVSGKLKVGKKIEKSRELFKLAMRQMFENGLPYCAFIDRINEYNPNKDDPEAYGIPCVNLCTESFSNVVPDKYSHVCNLASINLGSIRDFDHLAEVARKTTRILDYGISMTNNPTPETLAHNKRYRTIGIGVMGLHDYLAKNFMTYKNLDHIRDIFEVIQYNAVLESVELAKEFGSFEAFEYSTWKSGERIRQFKEFSNGLCDWDYAQSQIDKYGMRNSQLTSPAPTTSTSIYQDASASILPVYDAFFSESDKAGRNITVARYLGINPIGYARNQSQYDPKEIIDVTAEAQKFIDTGCSMELIFDQNKPDFKAKDLYDTIVYAYEKGLKSVYYIRSIKKNATILVKEEAACVGCAG